MLTRNAVHSGEYLVHLESLPNLWAANRIELSCRDSEVASGGSRRCVDFRVWFTDVESEGAFRPEVSRHATRLAS